MYSALQCHEVDISVMTPFADGETEAGEMKSLKLGS